VDERCRGHRPRQVRTVAEQVDSDEQGSDTEEPKSVDRSRARLAIRIESRDEQFRHEQADCSVDYPDQPEQRPSGSIHAVLGHFPLQPSCDYPTRMTSQFMQVSMMCASHDRKSVRTD
jgi:hypothetical protein